MVAPKEFIFKYLKYLPWVLVCAAIGLAIAYLKVRWTPPVYHVQSSMLVEQEASENPKADDPKFQDMFVVTGSMNNIQNEVAILRSSPIITRVVRALNLQTRYYNIGKIR